MTETAESYKTEVYHLNDNWDTIKYLYDLNVGVHRQKYPFTVIWHNKHLENTYTKSEMMSATMEFKQRFDSGGLELGCIDFVIKSGRAEWDPLHFSLSPLEANTTFAVKHTYVSTIPKKEYKHIDTSKLDEYSHYSLLSSVIWRLRLIGITTPRLCDKAFQYSYDDYIYIFLTGEEADYDKLSEEKKAIVDLKKQEADDFLRTLHTAIIENLKTMFKENS
jgi:hypothetical protein